MSRTPTRHALRRVPRRVARLALVALPILACGDATGPRLPSDGPPDRLRVVWAAWGAGRTTIELVGDRLHYTYAREPFHAGMVVDTVVVAPDAAAWRAFWDAADAVGLRTWPRQCVNRDVVDGGGVSIEVEHDGERLAIATSNASPGRRGRCDREGTTADERGLYAALAALVGQPFPGRVTRPTRATALPREGRPFP